MLLEQGDLPGPCEGKALMVDMFANFFQINVIFLFLDPSIARPAQKMERFWIQPGDKFSNVRQKVLDSLESDIPARMSLKLYGNRIHSGETVLEVGDYGAARSPLYAVFEDLEHLKWREKPAPVKIILEDENM